MHARGAIHRKRPSAGQNGRPVQILPSSLPLAPARASTRPDQDIDIKFKAVSGLFRHARGGRTTSPNVPQYCLAYDAESANLVTADVDDRDRRFIDTRSAALPKGLFPVKAGWKTAIAAAACSLRRIRDLLWCETANGSRGSRHFDKAIQQQFPASCWPTTAAPSFKWESAAR